MNEQELREAIAPKSDQLNYDDLVIGPITVTVKRVRKGNAEQKIVIDIGPDHQPYKPCKSMVRVMAAVWGPRPVEWEGQSMSLFGLASVKWAGVEVGGIRISHMTGIDAPTVVKLTTTKGSRSDYIVQPLTITQTPAKPQPAPQDTHTINGEITDVLTAGKRIGVVIGGLTLGTFDADAGKVAALGQGKHATATYTDDGKRKSLVTLVVDDHSDALPTED